MILNLTMSFLLLGRVLEDEIFAREEVISYDDGPQLWTAHEVVIWLF